MTFLVGFAAVARAADRAAREPAPVEDRRDTPSDPRWQEPCPDLEREYERFADDPITAFYGLRSEMAPLLTRQHVARHKCQGWGRP